MSDYLEIWSPGGVRVHALGDAEVTIGTSSGNSIVLDFDPTVSRAHAVLEPISGTWLLRDLGSTNGTYVNGERVTLQKRLGSDDEIRFGDTRVILRRPRTEEGQPTATARKAPELTPRERDVLVALCEPLKSGEAFTPAASIRQIAEALSVTEAAVKQHLARLYDKFEIFDQGPERRARLANEALRRGAISYADLRSER